MATPKQQNKIELERASNKKGGHQADQRDDSLSPNHQKSTSHEFISLRSSSSSSPSREFSFPISLHPSTTKSADKCNHSLFSPADDIFFEGHLLPLQLVSMHKSTTFSDNLRRPIRGDLIDDQKNNKSNNRNCSTTNSASATKERSNHKSFMFELAKWRKAFRARENHDDDMKKTKKEANFKVSQILKKYMRLIQQLFSKREKEKCDFGRQPYSLSGNLNLKWKERGGRRELSAPVSPHMSPSNSRLVLASPSESTMEELQNAIQAAVAHCKNSIGVKEDKCRG